MGLLSGLGADSGMFGLLPMLMQQQQGQRGMGAISDQEASQLGGLTPPSAPMGGGLAGAFSGNPQFQQQLQAIQNGQGPGHQAPQFTPPPMQMSAAPPTGGQGGMLGGRGGNPMNNYGMGTDPMQALMQRMGRSSY